MHGIYLPYSCVFNDASPDFVALYMTGIKELSLGQPGRKTPKEAILWG